MTFGTVFLSLNWLLKFKFKGVPLQNERWKMGHSRQLTITEGDLVLHGWNW